MLLAAPVTARISPGPHTASVVVVADVVVVVVVVAVVAVVGCCCCSMVAWVGCSNCVSLLVVCESAVFPEEC